MSKQLIYGVVALATIGAGAAPATADTITAIVAASGGDFDNNKFDYDILLNAVVTAGLADELNDPAANLTVFAPNDRAFIRLAKNLGYQGNNEANAWDYLVAALTDLGGGDPIPVLTAVLLYHVSPEDVTPLGLIVRTLFQIPVQTLQGGTFQPFFFKLIDNDPDLKNPLVTFPLNIEADNGRIHTIDRVLIPVDLP
jgi:uncharacterized surface protein with fasciclin (FAS1) repeats